MKRHGCFFAFLVLIACVSEAPQEGAWIQTDKTSVFKGAGLYNHINGGAEVFLDLGFEQVEVKQYSLKTQEIAVERYRMRDPVAALGIYLMKCGQEKSDPTFEERHTLNPYQIQFFKGSSYVIISHLKEGEENERSLLAFARKTAEEIPFAKIPDIFSILPEENRIRGTERVVRGPFTLQGVYTLGPGDMLQLKGEVTAVAADYESEQEKPITKILVDYPTEKAAHDAFEYVAAHLDPYLELLLNDGSCLTFKDYKARFGKIGIHGSRMELTLNMATL